MDPNRESGAGGIDSLVAKTPGPHQLQCLELWGGTQAGEEAASVHGIDFYVFSQPFGGEASGGDVYMVSMCGAGNIARFVLADVAGHGEAAGSLAKALRRLMRKHMTAVDQTRFACALNAEFSAVAREGKFATAVLLTYFAPTDHLIVVNAGHPPPLWYRAELGTWTPLDASMADSTLATSPGAIGVSNLPLGIVEPTAYEQFAVKLARDDLVLLYTDALIEARSPDGRELGLEGLLDLLGGMDVSKLERVSGDVRAAVQRFRDGAPPEDDLTVLVLHHNAADPPTPSLGERLRVVARMMGIGRIDENIG